jgi:hypothetical protein
MLTLCGWDLQLAVDKILCQSDSWFLGAATDEGGQRWLVHHRRVTGPPIWVCAEVSSRMLEEVEAGRADASDVFRHSLTGTVEIVSAEDRGDVHRDCCVCCAELPASLIGPGRLPAPLRSGRSRWRRPRPESAPPAAAAPGQASTRTVPALPTPIVPAISTPPKRAGRRWVRPAAGGPA